MSEENNNVQGTPTWNSLGKEMHPFLEANKAQMQAGLRGIKFLDDGPFKETMDSYKGSSEKKPKLWFLVEVKGSKMTFTTSAFTLQETLKNNAPLKGKTFDIQLVDVDEEFKKKNPNFKGQQRYIVSLLTDEVIKERQVAEEAPKPTEEKVGN